jgi:hypothetical protein
MRFHVVYETGSVDYFGSNVDHWDFTCYKPKWLSSAPGTQVITWQLNDLPLTKKWIEIYRSKLQGIINSRKSKNPFKYTTVYDLYSHVTEERILESYRVMNQRIDFINNCDLTKNTISNALKLVENNLDFVEIDKLNRLHEDFENIMNDLTDRRAAGVLHIPPDTWQSLWLALQSINLIVHFNEKIPGDIKEYLSTVEPFYFTALKWEEPPGTTVNLEPEDYADFTLIETPGTLWLDFSTVGKDLFHCFCTNDVELVQSNMVSPQWELKPWVSYLWSDRNKESSDDFRQEYENWLSKNNVSDYIDLTDPKYTPGRHPLGECISHTFQCPQDFIDAIVKHTPKIRSYFLTDDDGNGII